MIRHFSILILDDEEDICFLLGGFLKKHFNVVHSIHTIAELKKEDLSNYKIIFIDNNLPDGSGFEEIEQIKKVNPQINVIAISAFDTLIEREFALEKGAKLFLGKPFSQEQILYVIENIRNNEV